jgi:hypothetical protein
MPTHRKEGNIGNADYWYSKARQIRPAQSFKRGMGAFSTTTFLIEKA